MPTVSDEDLAHLMGLKPGTLRSSTDTMKKTLLDEFAIAAMSTLGSSFIGSGWSNPNEYQINVLVKNSYAIAKAMMTERSKAE